MKKIILTNILLLCMSALADVPCHFSQDLENFIIVYGEKASPEIKEKCRQLAIMMSVDPIEWDEDNYRTDVYVERFPDYFRSKNLLIVGTFETNILIRRNTSTFIKSNGSTLYSATYGRLNTDKSVIIESDINPYYKHIHHLRKQTQTPFGAMYIIGSDNSLIDKAFELFRTKGICQGILTKAKIPKRAALLQGGQNSHLENQPPNINYRALTFTSEGKTIAFSACMQESLAAQMAIEKQTKVPTVSLMRFKLSDIKKPKAPLLRHDSQDLILASYNTADEARKAYSNIRHAVSAQEVSSKNGIYKAIKGAHAVYLFDNKILFENLPKIWLESFEKQLKAFLTPVDDNTEEFFSK